MNETEIRILDTLSSEIGNSVSISDLTKKIRTNYGSSDYKNIHKVTRNLTKKNITKFEKNGNAVITKLNFENNLIVDFLTEIEIIKKIKFLETYKKFQIIFLELISHTKEFKQLKTWIVLNPNKNVELNKIELMMIINGNEIKNETKRIEKILSNLKNKHDIKIINVIVENNIFINYLKIQEVNTIKEILKDKLILFGSDTLWIEIKECITKGFNIKSVDPLNPNNILEPELIFNLTRFGYKEFEKESHQGKCIGLEDLIIIIFLKKEYEKYIKVIPILLLKNEEKINYNLLIYLSMKYKIEERLSNILKITSSIESTKKIIGAIEKLNREKTKL